MLANIKGLQCFMALFIINLNLVAAVENRENQLDTLNDAPDGEVNWINERIAEQRKNVRQLQQQPEQQPETPFDYLNREANGSPDLFNPGAIFDQPKQYGRSNTSSTVVTPHTSTSSSVDWFQFGSTTSQTPNTPRSSSSTSKASFWVWSPQNSVTTTASTSSVPTIWIQTSDPSTDSELTRSASTVSEKSKTTQSSETTHARPIPTVVPSVPDSTDSATHTTPSTSLLSTETPVSAGWFTYQSSWFTSSTESTESQQHPWFQVGTTTTSTPLATSSETSGSVSHSTSAENGFSSQSTTPAAGSFSSSTSAEGLETSSASSSITVQTTSSVSESAAKSSSTSTGESGTSSVETSASRSVQTTLSVSGSWEPTVVPYGGTSATGDSSSVAVQTTLSVSESDTATVVPLSSSVGSSSKLNSHRHGPVSGLSTTDSSNADTSTTSESSVPVQTTIPVTESDWGNTVAPTVPVQTTLPVTESGWGNTVAPKASIYSSARVSGSGSSSGAVGSNIHPPLVYPGLRTTLSVTESWNPTVEPTTTLPQAETLSNTEQTAQPPVAQTTFSITGTWNPTVEPTTYQPSLSSSNVESGSPVAPPVAQTTLPVTESWYPTVEPPLRSSAALNSAGSSNVVSSALQPSVQTTVPVTETGAPTVQPTAGPSSFLTSIEVSSEAEHTVVPANTQRPSTSTLVQPVPTSSTFVQPAPVSSSTFVQPAPVSSTFVQPAPVSSTFVQPSSKPLPVLSSAGVSSSVEQTVIPANTHSSSTSTFVQPPIPISTSSQVNVGHSHQTTISSQTEALPPQVTTSEPTSSHGVTNTEFGSKSSAPKVPGSTQGIASSETTQVYPTSSVATHSVSTSVVVPAASTASSATQFLPTYLLTQGPATTSSTSLPTGSQSSYTSSGSVTSPSSTLLLPYQIGPSEAPKADKSKKLVQIGFQFPLNYPFVAQHPDAAAQIFQYLPQGLAQGLDIDQGDVVMARLDPYQNNADPNKKFLQTIAKFYLPRNDVSTLQDAVTDPNSSLYQDQSDPTVLALLKLIDSQIPVDGNFNSNVGASGTNDGGGSGDRSGSSTIPGNPANSGTTYHGPAGGAGSLDQALQPDMKASRANGKVAGITIGTVVGAGIIASLLFVASMIIRSKFLRRKQNNTPIKPADMESYHDDMSSIASRWSRVLPASRGADPSVGIGAGAAGAGAAAAAAAPATPPVAPSAQSPPAISYPIVTENSLGWQ